MFPLQGTSYLVAHGMCPVRQCTLYHSRYSTPGLAALASATKKATELKGKTEDVRPTTTCSTAVKVR